MKKMIKKKKNLDRDSFRSINFPFTVVRKRPRTEDDNDVPSVAGCLDCRARRAGRSATGNVL